MTDSEIDKVRRAGVRHAQQAAEALQEVERLRAENERLRTVIDRCRESAGLSPSPDGPSGDVTNLLHRGDLALRNAR